MYADGKTQAVLTYYTDKDGQPAKTVTVDLGRTAKWDVYLLDETHNAERIENDAVPDVHPPAEYLYAPEGSRLTVRRRYEYVYSH